MPAHLHTDLHKRLRAHIKFTQGGGGGGGVVVHMHMCMFACFCLYLREFRQINLHCVTGSCGVYVVVRVCACAYTIRTYIYKCQGV